MISVYEDLSALQYTEQYPYLYGIQANLGRLTAAGRLGDSLSRSLGPDGGGHRGQCGILTSLP